MLCATISFAQTEYPLLVEYDGSNTNSINAYFKDVNNDLDKFVGTWKYESGNIIFEITFAKTLFIPGAFTNSYSDELHATYKLTIGGIVQYDTAVNPCEECYIPIGFSFIENYTSTGQSDFTPVSPDRYHFAIVDAQHENYVQASKAHMTYSTSGSNEILTWVNKIGNVYDYQTNDILNIPVMPLNMILVKQ